MVLIESTFFRIAIDCMILIQDCFNTYFIFCQHEEEKNGPFGPFFDLILFYAFFAETFFMMKRTAIVRTTPIARRITAFCVKPAMMYVTKEIAATVIA